MNTAKQTIAFLTGASLLALSAGTAMAGSKASVGAETTVETETSAGASSGGLNEAEKTDITGEEIVQKAGAALNAAGKAASDTATSAETTVRELLSSNDIKSVEGAAVRDMNGEPVGEIDGLVRSKVNNEVFFVVDVGGFLGLGEREVALPANRFEAGDGHLVLIDATRASLETYDEYVAENYTSVSVGADGSLKSVTQ